MALAGFQTDKYFKWRVTVFVNTLCICCYWQPIVCINTITAVNQIFINIRDVTTITITVLKLKYLQTTTITKSDVLVN